MKTLKLLTLAQKQGGDTYELAYAHNYPQGHWNPDSLYLSDDDNGINVIAPYLQAVFPVVHYYGDQKITLDEWQAVENAYRKSGEQNPSVDEFFASVKAWLAKGNGEESYFWFLGI